jgi:hypothetical protein
VSTKPQKVGNPETENFNPGNSGANGGDRFTADVLRWLGILLAVGCVAGAYPQAGNDSRQADVYAVYSALMSNPPMGSENPTYAILVRTKPVMNGPGQPCITPRPEQAVRWMEILADYNARVDKPPTLLRQLNIVKPYILISQEDATAFGATHPGLRRPSTDPQPPPPPPDPKFDGVTSILALSEVWLSKDHTLALTGITNFSASLWKLFEKNADGKWNNVLPAKECRQFI